MQLPHIIKKIKGIAVLIMLLYCSCGSKSISNNWTKDKNGCLQLRNKELADRLIKENDLMNDTEDSFLKVFGKPDTINQESGAESLTYYMKSMCENDQRVKESDQCWVVFYFKSGRLASYSFVCE